MIQAMHSSIEKNFEDVKGQVTDLEEWVASIEDKQKHLELQHFPPAPLLKVPLRGDAA